MREKVSPLLGGEAIVQELGGIVKDKWGEGNCESKIAARQRGVNFCREAFIGWSLTSDKRMPGTSRPSLGQKVFAFFSSFPRKLHLKKSLGIHLESPDILVPDVGDRPNSGHFQVTVCGVTFCPFSRHQGDHKHKCLKRRLKPPPNTHVTKMPFQ